MKNLYTVIVLLMATLNLSAQYELKTYSGQNPFRIETRLKHEIGARAGLNLSWFQHGDKEFGGFKYLNPGLIAGIYDKYTINKKVKIQAELIYISGGAKNPQENIHFITHYASIPVSCVLQFKDFNLQVGGYASKLIMARNWDFYDKDRSFDWPVWRWDYYHSFDYGLLAGMGYNLHNASVEIHYRHGLSNTRRLSYNNSKMERCNNAAADISLYIPFKNEN